MFIKTYRLLLNSEKPSTTNDVSDPLLLLKCLLKDPNSYCTRILCLNNILSNLRIVIQYTLRQILSDDTKVDYSLFCYVLYNLDKKHNINIPCSDELP